MIPRTKEPTDLDAFIAQSIRVLRRKRRLSQEKLGEFSGVTFQQIQKYENGTNRVCASRLARIALALQVPVADFFPARYR